MFAITKITQQYDEFADRMALSTENAAGDVLVLWLTQRLANRLVVTLAHWLEEGLRGRVGSLALPHAQSWEQSTAEARLQPTEPVTASKGSVEALLHSVDITRQVEGFSLTFRWGENQGAVRTEGEQIDAARMALSDLELRQWLAILYRLFETAHWHQDAWPHWFKPDVTPRGASSGALLH